MSIKGKKYIPKDPLHSEEVYLENFNVELLNELVSCEPDSACMYHIDLQASIVTNSNFAAHFSHAPITLCQLKSVTDDKDEDDELILNLLLKVVASRDPARAYVRYQVDSIESSVFYELTVKPVFQENKILLLVFREINESISPINSGPVLSEVYTQTQSYRALLDSTSAGFIKTDLNGRIVAVGDRTAHLFGFDLSYYKNKSVEYFLDIDNCGVIEKAEKKLVIQKKGLFNCKAIGNHSTGKKMHASINITLLGSHKKPKGYLLSCVDITKDYINNEKLKSARYKFRQIIENCPTGIVHLDLNHKIRYCSPSALSILNIDKSEVDHSQLSHLIHPNSIELLNAILDTVKETGEYKSENILQIHKSQSKDVYVEVRGKLIDKNQEDSQTILLMVQDVSVHIHSEIALIKQESLMHSILERTAMGIYALDKNFKILFANIHAKEDFKNRYGIDLEIGSNLKLELPEAAFSKKHQEHYQKVLAGDVITDIITHDKSRDKTLHTQYYPLKNIDGKIYSCLGVSQDISSIKQNEIQLNERQAYLSTILDSSPDGICVFDLKLKIAVVNPKMNELFLPIFHNKTNIGDNLYDILPKQEIDKLTKIVDQVFNGKSIQLISKFKVEDCSKYFDLLYAPVRDSTADIIACMLVVRDMTDHYLNEKQLISNEKRYRDLVEFLPCGIVIIDNNAHVKYFSNKTKSLLASSDQDLKINASFYDLFEEDQSYICQAFNNDLGDDETLLPLTPRHKRSPSVIELKTKEIEYENQNCLLILLFDITEEINTIKEKEERQQIYETLIENALEAIDIIEISIGNDGSLITELRQRNRQMLQYFKGNEKTQGVNSILNNAPLRQSNGQLTKDVLKADLAEFMRKGQLVTERLVYDVDRNERHIQLSTQLLEVNGKKIIIRNYKDITDKKLKDIQIENNLREINNKNIQLEKYIKSNYDLKNFAFIASHDLKAPLRTILSFSQLLKRSVYNDLSDKERVFIDIILRSSKSMEELIEDLLKYSDVNSSNLNIVRIDTLEFMNDLLINISSDIKSTGAKVNIKRIPEFIYGDKIKLGQLFQNLIRNGIKFHKLNELPEINIDYVDLEKAWQFSIQDNGIGIAKENLSDIFEIFKTLHNKSDYKGHGIGLSICQQIVTKHDGTIWVDSTEGEGSTFIFSIKKPA